MKKRYEYRQFELSPLNKIKDLNELGRKGWYPSSIPASHRRGTVLMRELEEEKEAKEDAPKQDSPTKRMLKDCENFPRETVNRWMKEGKYDIVLETAHFRAKQQEDKETISNTIKEAYVRPPSHLTAADKAVLDRFTPAYGKDVIDFCNTEGEVSEVNPPHPTMKDAPNIIQRLEKEEQERFKAYQRHLEEKYGAGYWAVSTPAVQLPKQTSDPILPETLDEDFKEEGEYKEYFVVKSYEGNETGGRSETIEGAISSFMSLFPGQTIKSVESTP
jgi:hypothetical protein